jgi:PDZ domain-containing secreted protein
MKAAHIQTLGIQESSKIDIESTLEITYVNNLPDQQELGIGVTHTYKSGSEPIGLKVTSIEVKGLLYKTIGSKLQLGDAIVDINGIPLENLSTKLGCKLLNQSINRKITILHTCNNEKNNNNNNEYINIKEEWAFMKYNYLLNRINKDKFDMKNLSYRYNCPPLFKKQKSQQLENLLIPYYKYQQIYKTA